LTTFSASELMFPSWNWKKEKTIFL